MKKSKKKVLFTAVVLISAVVISINVGISNQKNELLSLLSMDNIEALAGETGGFDCYLHKDDCVFSCDTYVNLMLFNSWRTKKGLPIVGFGATMDISDMTALYSIDPNDPPVRVRCGTDVNCNQLMTQILN